MNSFKEKKYWVAGFVVFLFIVVGVLYLQQEPESITVKDTSCVAQEKDFVVKGDSMNLSFPDGSKVKALEGYFDCNVPEKEQVVVLEFKTRTDSFVKRIRGVGGDTLQFQGSQALLNGELLKNQAGQAYQFSSRSQKLLSIPLREGVISKGYFLVLSDDPSANAFDSRQFAYVEEDHIKGLVVSEKE
jgi:signal peptidase I